MKYLVNAILFFLFINGVYSQNFWSEVNVEDLTYDEFPERNFPEMEASVFRLNIEELKEYLRDIPMENSGRKPKSLVIPLPDGSFEVFEVYYSPVMANALAEKYPAIKTFSGKSKGGLQVLFGYGERGFFAVIREKLQVYQIDNYSRRNTKYYIAYDTMSLPDEYFLNSKCSLCDGHKADQNIPELLYTSENERNNEVVEVITFRLGIATTGEFSARFGGTKESVLEELVRHVVNLNMIFLNELSSRFELIANQDRLINLDPLNDGLTNGQNSNLLTEVVGAFNRSGVFPEDFDIGHVFGTGGGGVAFLNSLCTSNSNDGRYRKAQGVSSHSGGSTTTSSFLKLVAHEMGHQFGANHSFNSCLMDGNENSNTGFEPGSGNTIMSYQGLCGPDNTESDLLLNYNFHALAEMYHHIYEGNASQCGSRISIGNTRPEVIFDYKDDFFIPIGTPFKLSGEGLDNESPGESLTFSWEQANTGNPVNLGMPIGTSPLFRAYRPSLSPVRYFPRLDIVLANSFNKSEVLPEISRNLDFRLVVRDNHSGGGAFNTRLLKFRSTADAGPFQILTSTGGKRYEVGDIVTLEWDVAATDQAPVNCKTVNIGVLEGGNKFIPLAENVFNNGYIELEIPEIEGNQFRFYVEAADNIFYNISSGNFFIDPSSNPKLSVVPENYFAEVCSPGIYEVDFAVNPIGGFQGRATVSYSGGLPPGTVVTFDKNEINENESFTAFINIMNSNFTGIAEMEIEVIIEGGDTLERKVIVEILSSDFSELEGLTPLDGETEVGASYLFSWSGLENAESYYLTINSLSGEFEEIRYNLTDTFFHAIDVFPISTAFIWSVGAQNSCADKQIIKSYSFSTVNLNCKSYTAEDLPLFLSQNMVSTRESKINVPDDFEIVDVNIPVFKGNQSDISKLTATIINPQGQSVTLLRNPCVSQGWNAAFDDQSPTPYLCIFVNGITQRPLERLSDFNGGNAQGEWTFRFTNNLIGVSAQVWEIGLEICGNVSRSIPKINRNEVLLVPALQFQTITTDFLDITDEDSGNDEVFISLIEPPKKGHISIYGSSSLKRGDSFTLSALKDFGVVYFHEGENSDTEDYFRFVVRDIDGGYIGTFNFDIEISEDFVVSNTELLHDSNVSIYPNPTKGLFHLEYSESKVDHHIYVLNLNGQIVKSIEGLAGSNKILLDLSGTAPGVYFIRIENEREIGTAKLIIQ